MKKAYYLIVGGLLVAAGLFLAGCSYDSKHVARGVCGYCSATTEAERDLIRDRVREALGANCPGAAIEITCPGASGQ
ncbi:MAG: hypothetical protein K0U84_13585 [Actinomycetia bacterium]|nr:hypothetical protein [Actinomycetes bacterium]